VLHPEDEYVPFLERRKGVQCEDSLELYVDFVAYLISWRI